MVELHLLEQLLTFRRVGTLSAAAEELHISQPALSQSMKKLEEAVGVGLFERTKNKLTLNENGALLAELAEHLLSEEEAMRERVRNFDRSNHTVSFGSSAPVPLDDILPELTREFAGNTVTSELVRREEDLLAGLFQERYQLVVVHEQPAEPERVFCLPYREEHLSLLVPMEHPLATKKALHLKDLEGQNLLLYTEIGFWYDMCRENLPGAHYLQMAERSAFEELAGAGAFPSFTTDAASRRREVPGKVEVPILDEAVHVTYYIVCKTEDRPRFEPLMRRLQEMYQ